MVQAIIIVIGILTFLMAFSIGANDAANALATSYGSNALKLIYLVILGSLCEFLGAFFCSSHVAGTLVDDVIEGLPSLTNKQVEQTALVSCFCATFTA